MDVDPRGPTKQAYFLLNRHKRDRFRRDSWALCRGVRDAVHRRARNVLCQGCCTVGCQTERVCWRCIPAEPLFSKDSRSGCCRHSTLILLFPALGGEHSFLSTWEPGLCRLGGRDFFRPTWKPGEIRLGGRGFLHPTWKPG